MHLQLRLKSTRNICHRKAFNELPYTKQQLNNENISVQRTSAPCPTWYRVPETAAKALSAAVPKANCRNKKMSSNECDKIN
jgi:hypothetical protein